MSQFAIAKVEAVFDEQCSRGAHRAVVGKRLFTIVLGERDDVTLEAEESHRKFETRRGGGAKDAEFRNLDWSVYAKFSSTQNGVRLRSAETLLWSISPLYKFGN